MENPLGIISLDSLEFCCDSLDTKTKELFYTFGYEKTHTHPTQQKELFSQGSSHFLLNANPKGRARDYFKAHGEGVSKMSFLVKDAEAALIEAKKRGAEVVEEMRSIESEHGVYRMASIQGFGDVLNEFVERPRSFFRPGFEKLELDPKSRKLKAPMVRVDHLTNNVPYGEMDKWVEFYERIYGFKVTRFFDIKGVKTGLESKVVQMPNGAVIIPINEPSEPDSKSQIQEFLDLHKGAGVQHIALTTTNIVSTISELRERGIKFLEIPSTYYDQIPSRGISPTESRSDLETNHILVDGNKEGYLLQIFTETYVGPLFFEVIQRKNEDGFGEGNFQALFDAIEADQVKRGYLE